MPSKRPRINELPLRACMLLLCPFAPIIGIDKYSQSFYFRYRRQSKGLASITCGRSEVGWVIGSARQLVEPPNPKKPTDLRGAVGVWNRESGDRIKGLRRCVRPRCQLPRRSWRLEHNQCRSLLLSHRLHSTHSVRTYLVVSMYHAASFAR